MPTFLTTNGVSDKVETIIKKAEEKLYIFSPYLKINERFKQQIARQAQNHLLSIHLVYGKQELAPDEINWLSQQNIKTHFRKNLHAKCYMNEKQAIVTSMNLYEFSQVHNEEFGILLDNEKQEDQAAFKEMRQEVIDILNTTAPVTLTATHGQIESDSPPSKPATQRQTPAPKPPTASAPTTTKAYCIQNAKEMDFNAQNPVCGGCHYMNNKFKRTAKGKHCHACGKEHDPTVSKPVCPACYPKVKDLIFASSR